MNKEDILKRSREENRKGDEYEKVKRETASNNGYRVATFSLALLAISCYLGITNGDVIIKGFDFKLSDILWGMLFLTNLVEYGSKYVYLKQKKYFIYAAFWFCGLIGCFIVMFRG